MPATIIISYDGTNNEDDAIAYGRILAQAGAEPVLAYVRHSPLTEGPGGGLGDGEAGELLARGLEIYGSAIETHVVVDRSTPAGLQALAQRIGAEAVIFCSDSHTAAGHIGVGNSAERLLEGGTVAVGIAPAGLATQGQIQLRRVATTGGQGQQEVDATAAAIARVFGAEVVPVAGGRPDLVVLGSRPEAETGRVSISASVQNLLDISTAPVLVLARGRALSLGGDRLALAG